MKSIILVLALASVLILPMGAGAATRYRYRVLHQFTGGTDGASPNGDLIVDKAGNLYGTTQNGGVGEGGDGTVFKLAPNPNGTWTETVLYRFSGEDGHGPVNLVFDGAGNLYGSTYGGGAYNEGEVFKLTPNQDGTCTETVVYSFPPIGSEGTNPESILFDAAGNLYGTTFAGGNDFGGGNFFGGTAFKLAPSPGGTWTETVLHDFCYLSTKFPDCPDGALPMGKLVFDKAGNLYGTTINGGSGGTVFELTPNPDGTWTENVLFGFPGDSGMGPRAGVIFDPAGNLYGTTFVGGDNQCNSGYGFLSCGLIFQLTPNASGTWTEQVLHVFEDPTGANPEGGLIRSTTANFYGTTLNGGKAEGGVVFELAPKPGGGWQYNVLHNFMGRPALHPYGSLLIHRGRLYGMTQSCGSEAGCQGVVFEITPIIY